MINFSRTNTSPTSPPDAHDLHGRAHRTTHEGDGMRYTRDAAGRKRVTLIEGDGIGPEVVHATRRILDAAGANLA
jgi:hypothetical protein